VEYIINRKTPEEVGTRRARKNAKVAKAVPGDQSPGYILHRRINPAAHRNPLQRVVACVAGGLIPRRVFGTRKGSRVRPPNRSGSIPSSVRESPRGAACHSAAQIEICAWAKSNLLKQVAHRRQHASAGLDAHSLRIRFAGAAIRGRAPSHAPNRSGSIPRSVRESPRGAACRSAAQIEICAWAKSNLLKQVAHRR